jgi:hypothetical protein
MAKSTAGPQLLAEMLPKFKKKSSKAVAKKSNLISGYIATPKAKTVTDDDGLGIPGFLKRDGNGSSLPSSSPSSPPPVATESPAKKKRFDIPPSMTEEEYEKKKTELVDPPKKEPAKSKKIKKERVKREAAPHGTFRLADWAREEGLDPRHVRRAARANKAKITALQAADLKYVFDEKSKDAVAKIIRDGLASETSKKVKVTKKKTKKAPLPPPSETEWVEPKKVKPDLVVKSPKEKLRDEGKKAVTAFKKKKK